MSTVERHIISVDSALWREARDKADGRGTTLDEVIAAMLRRYVYVPSVSP